MNSPTTLNLDAEALYAALRQGVRNLLAAAPDTVLVGIWSGGAWLAARLHAELALPGEAGVISSTLQQPLSHSLCFPLRVRSLPRVIPLLC